MIFTANQMGEIKTKLDCQFNSGERYCKWTIDQRDETATWESMNYGIRIGDAACMSANSDSGETVKHSARLWSPWLRFSKMTDMDNIIKCLQFVYRIDIGNKPRRLNQSKATLALLKHSKG